MTVMRKLPNKITILGIPFRVRYYKNAIHVDGDKKDEYLGSVAYEESLIRIFDGGRSKELIWKTIWHEILHAIFNETKLFKYVKNEERVVETIASALPTVKFD